MLRHAKVAYIGPTPSRDFADVRGPGAETLIDRINAAVADYSFASSYRVWPGPNSNTFTAEVLRAVPELRVDLPANAIGKDFLHPPFVARTPGGKGVQVNAFGVAGVLVGWHEGIEINIAGLVFGINPARLGLRLPLLGNVDLLGPSEQRILP